uniref:FecR family protein n=1 Tax=Pedobacter schmidteae TaxID=2201271 RepID=UPI000EB1F590|nr:FecR family protein [Pedobacter schmidteae]
MKERINDLLLKFEKGTLTEAEKAELLALSDDNELQLSNAITEMIDRQVPGEIARTGNWEAVVEKIVRVDKPVAKKVKTISLFKWISAAAILFTLGIGYWYYTQATSQNDLNKSRYANDVPPGGNEAILTLADGSKISLTDAAKGELLNKQGVRIVKTKDGQLVYTVDPGMARTDEVVVFNTITTPRGGQYQINLPDGTKVWLNAASALKFPTTFANLKERRVELSGEAYFEVSKNKQQPFKVLSSAADKGRAQETEVLGTHFNINAYEDEDETKTTLLEGAVKVAALQNANKKHDMVLSPGQQAVLSNSGLKTMTVDTEEAIAWKNGNFMFANEGIESIMRKLARWYNIEVVYQGKITDKDFVGTVPRFKNISEALTILELTNNVHFKIEGRRVTVMP